MGRPSIVPELLEKLEPYLEIRAAAWDVVVKLFRTYQ